MNNDKKNRSSLNDPQKQDFSEFEALLTLWKGAYKYAQLSYVGMKDEQGSGLFYGRIILAPSREGFNNTEFRFETEHVIAARFIIKLTGSDVLSFLENAKLSEVRDTNNGRIIRLISDERLFTDFEPIHHPFFPEGPGRMPCLLIRGTSLHHLLVRKTGRRQVDWELKAADLPFYNLDELLIHCGLPPQAQIGDLTTLEIIANSPGFISDKSIITGGEATIECHIVDTIDIEKIKIGYNIFQKESIERANIAGKDLVWHQEGDFRICSCRVPVKDAPLLHAFLSYSGVAFYHWSIMDPQKRLNFRHAIHEVLDEKLDVLKKMLFRSKPDKSDEFEFAVSTLASLLGFSTLNYGTRRKLMQGPDIIAVTPIWNIAVIECTLGLPDNRSKLTKVAEKTVSIKNKLKIAGFGNLQVQPTVVTPLSREEVEPNFQEAARLGIALVCKEDIEELLRRVILPQDPERLFQELKGMVLGMKQDISSK